MKRFLGWLLSPTVIGSLGLLALSLVIWWVGPLLGFGESHPLASAWARLVWLVLLWALWGAWLGWKAWRRRKTNAALLAGLGGGPSASDKEAQVLAQRFTDAVQRLRANASRRWWGGGQYLYELPWYMFVGAPGSGKTTALMNAGLQFLLGDAQKGSVRGVGGTRNCEWWFTQDAVLVDTAGRYATQESDREVDASAWDRFLALLKGTRPRQPINGVLLTINVQDLLQQAPRERAEHAAKLRARLQELHAKLGVRPPVYALVTKADLIGGFNESFEALGKAERDQVWGFSFAADQTAGSDPMADFVPLYEDLQQRLLAQLIGRLESERDVLRRSAMLAFPQEFAALRPLLEDFLRQVVSQGGSLETAPRLRGVYFCSGTQEGSPIDRVMGSIGRSLGMDGRAAGARPSQGKSYFLHQLLRDVIFAERGLGAIDPVAERRRRTLRTSAMITVAVASVVVLTLWAISRARNLDYAAQVMARVPAVKAAVDALPPATTADVAPLPPVLQQVRDAAHDPNFDLDHPPLLNTFGLYQGEKLDAAAHLAYERLLREELAPRVARRLEERVRAASKDNLENAYEALKSYLMLYSPDHFDAAALKAWCGVDWDVNFAQMPPEQRATLDKALDDLLAMGPPGAALPRDDALVASVRDMLAAYPLEYRIYSRIRRQYRPGEVPDFTVAGAAGPNAAQVFERTSREPLTKGVSGLYTKAGYERLVKPSIQKEALKLAQEQSWVLGIKGDAAQLKDLTLGTGLSDKVRRLYFEDYIKTWDALIGDVHLVPLTDLQRNLAVARALSAVDSPLAAFLRGVSAETTLVPAPGAASALDALATKAKADAAKLVGDTPADNGGAGPLEKMVDDHFAGIHRLVTGQPAPIDDTLKLFADVYAQLSAVDAAQKSKSAPPAGGGAGDIKARAGQQPEPVRSMLEQLANASDSQSQNAVRIGLTTELKPVTDFCLRATNGRYPFASGAKAEVPPDDFGQLFGAGGLLDDFFNQRLRDLVDVSAATWTYKPLASGARPVAPGALAEFQRAARIRDAFFRAGGKVPAVKFEMRLLEIDPALKGLDIDIDGQAQHLAAAGPPITLTWPPQRLSSEVKLSTDLGAGGPQFTFDGPWALFRLFDRFVPDPSPVPEKFTVTMNLDGHKARIEVISASVLNPFQLKELKQFRCPGAL